MGPHSEREGHPSIHGLRICSDGDCGVVGGCRVRDSAVRRSFIVVGLFLVIESPGEMIRELRVFSCSEGTAERLVREELRARTSLLNATAVFFSRDLDESACDIAPLYYYTSKRREHF